ncbi:hypothetical protein EJ04DRAFT_173568 [Polyplosphaeria fusca]|uniref:SART-1 n=1 Tax=Polyplosphaeria fusca TaxID=682080 RepID=A0A9P4QKT9_9PLEO|nr:hypothetical protein EJ04DRAFT_173568 [Polyplosphaeria fusca]
MANALAIAEANKIRAAMGMPLLPSPNAPSTATAGPAFKAAQADTDSDDELGSTYQSRQDAASGNWEQHQAEQDARKARDAKKARLIKEREKAQRDQKLKGLGLADAAGEADDMAWLKGGSKKRQKQIAKAEKTRQQLEQQEQQAREALQYTEEDLAGVKVGHEVSQFDGDDAILVLRDAAVDEEGEDELESVALKEKERLQERLDSKKRKRAYDPNHVDEDGQASLLQQYDEAINGKKRNAFTLDGQGNTVEATSVTTEPSKRVAISLDILTDDTPSNDYMDASSVRIKKPKKKKKTKSSHKTRIDDGDDAFTLSAGGGVVTGDMDVDEPAITAPKPKKKLFEGSFVDDEDLQANLAAHRQRAWKNRKKMRPEDLARQVRQEVVATPDVGEATEGAEEDANLIIDENTEFVNNLQPDSEDEEAEKKRRRQKRSAPPSSGGGTPGEGPSIDNDGDVEMDRALTNEQYGDNARARSVSAEADSRGIGEEATVGTMAGAVTLLRQRGLMKDAGGAQKNADLRQKHTFLAARQKAGEEGDQWIKEQREKDRSTEAWRRMSAREREDLQHRANIERDKFVSRREQEIFNREYKPTIELLHIDDHGRQMTPKEAFKQLSHQFHGKGSGNTKTQKYLDKVAAENRKMAESSLETSLSGAMTAAQDQQSKKNKAAGVRLQ